MAKKYDSETISFNVDISKLKKEFNDAATIIRVANSEFKKSSAGLDDWSKDADGVTAKCKQLNDVIKAQGIQLSSLEEQYKKTAEHEGKNSQGAQELIIKINNLKASIKNNEKQLGNYTDSLKKLNEQNVDTRSSAQRLSDAIDSQEKELEKLKDDYASIVISQGKGSDEARRLSNKISDLSEELNQNKEKLSQARDAADRFDDSLDDTGDSAEETSGGFTVLKGALANLVADGIKAAISGFKDLTEEMLDAQGAYNDFQAKTGSSKEEMKQFTEQMDELYKNNYGESLNDVADSMAKVSQYTGEVNPENLKKLTENVYAFSETFDADFDESLRGADGLMKNMGLTADEAFDLMAKGAQNGLDKSGELGDNIAEYSQLWGQAGFSAQEMFGVLENGLESGAYNLDKVNDFVKEFGVSLTDGRFEENINSFSDSTQSLFKQWQNGKATTKDVFMSVIADLNDTKTEQEALTTASSVWSSLGEDNALKVIRSLGDVNENYKSVKGTMEDIKKVKYDDLQNDMSSLGRTIQIDIIKPVLDKGLPKIRKAVKEHAPEIKRVVSDCVSGIVKFLGKVITNFDDIKKKAKVAGAAIGAMFITNKIIGFVTGIVKLVKTYTTLKAAIEATTTAQKLMNLTNPVGIATLAAGAIAGLVIANKNAKDSTKELSAEQQALIDKTTEMRDACAELDSSWHSNSESVRLQFDSYETLVTKLDSVVDANGKVKKGHENEAKYITGELSDALGMEIEMRDGVIDKYKEVRESIESTMKLKEAEAFLDANQQNYYDAQKQREEALERQAAMESDLIRKSAEIYAAEMGLYDLENKRPYAMDALAKSGMNLAEAQEYQKEKIATLRGEQELLQGQYDDLDTTIANHNTMIQNYDSVSTAVMQSNTEELGGILTKAYENFATSETSTREVLEQQVLDYQTEYENMKIAVENGNTNITQADLNAKQQLYESAKAELDKKVAMEEQKAKEGTEKTAQAISSGKGKVQSAAADVGAAITGPVETDLSRLPGIAGAKSGSMADAVRNARGQMESAGYYAAEGAAVGAESGSGLLANAASSLAGRFVNTFRNILRIQSPSRVMMKLGGYVSEGLAVGIAKGAKDVIGSVKTLARDAVDTMDRETEGFGNSIFGSVNASLPQLRRAITPSAAISGGSVVNNNYSTTSNCSYNQTNISPKPLQSTDIYRQTKSLMRLKGV